MNEAAPPDDPTIADDAVLWRRVPRHHFIPDQNLGRMRPTSAAFEDHPNGSPMSVLLQDLVLASGRTAESVLPSREEFALASITAGFARSCNQGVVRTPQLDEPAHADVVGNKTESVRKRLAKEARWVVPPADSSS